MGLIANSETLARRRPADRPALRRLLALAALLLAVLAPSLAFGQDISIDFGNDTTITERAVQLVGLITLLSLAPSILVMVTSFTRIVVVLSLLRTAIGLQTAPPNSVMVSLALFLTFFIMQPTFQAAYDQGVAPLLAGQIEIQQAFEQGSVPLHDFMAANTRQQDIQLFYDLSNQPPPEDAETIELRILVPAFMISELRRAFEIGFLLFLPFVGGGPNSTPLLALVGIVLVFTVAELLLSPVGLSVTTKLAPAAFHTQMVALFYLSVSLGTAVSGELAKLYSPESEASYFTVLGLIAIGIGVLLAVASPWVLKLMRGVR